MWSTTLRNAACALVLIGMVLVLPAAATDTIAFMSSRDGTWAIYTMDPATDAATRLTTGDERDCDPAWSPDGARIAFVSYRDGGAPEIYAMNADGSGQARLTANAAFDGTPAWSPDGATIAFASDRDGDGDIYVMRPDGTRPVNLIARGDRGSEKDPAWSPDGARIAFTSDRDGNAEVYVMNADGSGQTRLTTSAAWDGTPAWSPDGSRIAFRSNRDGNNEVYVMDADGSDQRRLTVNPGADAEPAWSPDGTRIAFESDRDGNVDLHVMDADGSGQERITTDAAFDGAPAWSGAPSTVPEATSPPVITGVRVLSTLVTAGQTVSATATFTDDDAGRGERHTATWSWGDGSTSTGTSRRGSVSGTHAYSSTGVYRVTVTVADDGGLSGTASAPSYVVVYDRTGGLVAGSGWIRSPAGAYLAKPGTTGAAVFGFTAQYQPDAVRRGAALLRPKGEGAVSYRLEDLDFASSSCDRLVLSGSTATISGTGTINGKGLYGFVLTASDGQQRGGRGLDRLRVTIWDQRNGRIVYDSQPGAGPGTAPGAVISNGAISIA